MEEWLAKMRSANFKHKKLHSTKSLKGITVSSTNNSIFCFKIDGMVH
jgi:hypothetical protein